MYNYISKAVCAHSSCMFRLWTLVSWCFDALFSRKLTCWIGKLAPSSWLQQHIKTISNRSFVGVFNWFLCVLNGSKLKVDLLMCLIDCWSCLCIALCFEVQVWFQGRHTAASRLLLHPEKTHVDNTNMLACHRLGHTSSGLPETPQWMLGNLNLDGSVGEISETSRKLWCICNVLVFWLVATHIDHSIRSVLNTPPAQKSWFSMI